MIAKLSIILPFPLLIPKGQVLNPHSFHTDGIKVTMLPPTQAALSTAALIRLPETAFHEIIENIKPVDKLEFDDRVRVNGSPTLKANLLQIEFQKNHFDRTRRDGIDVLEFPEVRFMFETLNRFLHKVRTVAQAHHIKEIDPHQGAWRIDYLTDDYAGLEPDPELFRMLRAVGSHRTHCAITTDTWASINSLPSDFKTSTYDTIFLDAQEMVPDWGPAIVLAFTALETLVSTSLEVIHARKPVFSPEFWGWLLERDGDFRKEPAVAEEFTKILKELTGKSLKDDSDLWQQFNELKAARNNYIHNGILALGRKPKYTLISAEKAQQLIASAGKIIAYIENILPEEFRRRMSKEAPLNWTWTKAMSIRISNIDNQMKGEPTSTRPPASVDVATSSDSSTAHSTDD